MTEQQAKEKIESITREVAELEEYIEGLNKPKAERFRAKIGAEHLLIDTIGEILNSSEIGCHLDKQRHEVGNYYPDTAEGRARAERMAEIATVLRLVEHQPGVNWQLQREAVEACYIAINRTGKRCYVTYYCYAMSPVPVPFESEEAAQAALEAVGEERILKAFNVI